MSCLGDLSLRRMIWVIINKVTFENGWNMLLINGSSFMCREGMGGPTCSRMWWMWQWGWKKIDIWWRACTQWLTSVASNARRFLVGNMRKLMKNPRSTRKESISLRGPKSWKRTGEQLFVWILYICGFVGCTSVLCILDSIPIAQISCAKLKIWQVNFRVSVIVEVY